jgi:hypothetical protein
MNMKGINGVNVQGIREVIRMQRSMGLEPQELHMRPETFLKFIRDAALKPTVKPDNRSVLAKMVHPRMVPEPVYKFDDVTLVANEQIPGASMILRPPQLMHDPEWLKYIVFGRPVEQPQLPADGSTPWHKRVEQGEAQSGGDVDVLEALTSGNGITPSSVVMEAMKGIEKVQNIVVLRFKKTGDVDVCATFDRHALIGALHDAIMYVSQGR